MKPGLRGITIGVAVVVVIGTTAVLVARWLSEDQQETSDPKVFSDETDVALIFHDGIDGVLAIFPDRGVASRRLLEGMHPGDPPYHLFRAEDSLVVWGQDITRVPLDGRPPTTIGSATYMVPAVEPDRVWLVEYSGQYISQGDRTIQQVTLDGTIVTESHLGPDNQSFPSMGIPGGLAFDSPRGLEPWDASTEKVLRTVGDGQSFASDATTEQIAWCDRQCEALHITNFDGEDRLVMPPSGTAHFDAREARFSPTGEMLAAVARHANSTESSASIVLVIATTMESQVVAREVDTGKFYVEWSPDGSQLFFSTNSYQLSSTILGRYEQRTQLAEIVRLRVRGALSFVVVEEPKADFFFAGKLGAAKDCPDTSRFPSGRASICGFELQPSRLRNA